MTQQAYIGIDLGGTNIKYGLVTPAAKVIQRGWIPTAQTRRAIMSQFVAIVREMMGTAKSKSLRVDSVGVGSPGIVDITLGKVVGGAPNVPEWRGADIRGALQKRSGLAVFADNDANVMALAEHRYGAGKGCRSGLYITVGTGLGSGIILDNRIWRGSRFAGAELGHSIIKLDGVACQCGKRGCLEMYVNAASFVKFYGKKLPAGTTSKDIFDRALRKDMNAIAAVRQSADFLAVGLGSACEVLNPEVIVIGGGVAAAGKLYIGTIREQIRYYTSRASLKGLRILRAKLGNDAGLIGAALLPLEPELSNI